MEILFEKNRICTKTIIKKDVLKSKFFDLKTTYKKFMQKYIEKNFNETFGIVSLTSYFLLLKTRLYQENPNINIDVLITYDNENFYIRFNIIEFYDRDLSKYNNDQLELLYKNHFDENEKEVFNDYIKNIPNDEFLNNNIHKFINMMFNCDDLIKELKQKVSNKEMTLEQMEFEISKYFFGSFALSINKNLAVDELLEK